MVMEETLLAAGHIVLRSENTLHLRFRHFLGELFLDYDIWELGYRLTDA